MESERWPSRVRSRPRMGANKILEICKARAWMASRRLATCERRMATHWHAPRSKTQERSRTKKGRWPRWVAGHELSTLGKDASSRKHSSTFKSSSKAPRSTSYNCRTCPVRAESTSALPLSPALRINLPVAPARDRVPHPVVHVHPVKTRSLPPLGALAPWR